MGKKSELPYQNFPNFAPTTQLKAMLVIQRLFYGFFLCFTVFSCATIAAPEGGPKDTIPPLLDTLNSTANEQVNFTKQPIALTFQEWVILEDVNNQVLTSPPLEFRPQIKLKRRTVLFEFDAREQLRPNVTYTINFGNWRAVAFFAGFMVLILALAVAALADSKSDFEKHKQAIMAESSLVRYYTFEEGEGDVSASVSRRGVEVMKIDIRRRQREDSPQPVFDQKIKLGAYPNPFAKQATIAFTLPTNEQLVTLDVYDLKGSKISRMYEGKASANQTLEFSFNGSNLSAGMYFLRLTTPTKVENFKMIMTE